MGITAALALVCYISSNPSPQQWLVSGRAEAVAQLDAMVADIVGVRRIAHAEDGDIAFSRFETGANPPNRIMWGLYNTADRAGMLSSRLQHVVPSCPSGERSEVGKAGSPLTIALIGPAEAIGRLNLPPQALSRAVELDDGRTGLGFALKYGDRENYDMLIRRAAAGFLPGVDLVLVRTKDAATPGTGFPAPLDQPGREPTRATSPGH